MSVQEKEPEIEDESLDEPEVTKLYHLEIYNIIRDAQQQHGLRHGDYQRYRGYCSRRLRRLRRVLKLPQGDKRHFKRRDVTSTIVKDDKFLQIPLMMAERAWSYAMQLRQESNTEPRKKFHLVSRLRKAANYSLQLQELIEKVNCDPRTKLEAQAYVAWMHGSLHFELELWKSAMEKFKEAQVVYKMLSSALPDEEQALYKARVEELDPSLRYCSYNIGDAAAIEDLVQMRGQLSGDMLANLDSLIAQTQEKQASTEGISWRGKSCGVVPRSVAGLLLADSQLNQALTKAANVQAKIDLLEAHLIECKDAVSAVREAFKNELRQKDDERSAPATHLLSYVQYIRLSRTMERNLLLVEAAEQSDKTKAQDIVRLYEAVLHNVVEISQLQVDEEFVKEQEVKKKFYRAFRCFYMAKSLSHLRRWREAVALYQRSQQHVSEAVTQESLLPEEMKKSLQKLKTDIEGAQYAVKAHSVLEDGQEAEAQVGKLAASQKTLYERLEEYREDPSLITKNPNVYKLPPPMQSIACEPLFFDLAFNKIEFPDLSEKMQDPSKKKAEGLSGLVKGLWNWGK